MDIMFHAPYVLRPLLALLGLGVAWAVGRAYTLAGRERARAVQTALVLGGGALLVGGGMEATRLVPNAHAANLAAGTAFGLAVAGVALIAGALVTRSRRSPT